MMKKDHAAKRSWRVLALALCLAMLVGLLPTVALAAEINDAVIMENGTVTNPASLTINETTTLNVPITVKSGYARITGGGTLVRGSSLTGAMITVESGATLILDNVTVDGEQISGSGYRGIYVDGTLIMGQGAVLKNHYNSSSEGSALHIASNAKVEMNGGEIANNSSYNYGNIYIYDNAQFTMNGGEIHDNTLTCNGEYGGGAFYVRGGTLTVNGGSIYNHTNITSRGGAIYCSSYGTVYLNGGTIEKNTVASGKLGDAIYYSNREGNAGQLYIGGTTLITDSIYLGSSDTNVKYPYITSVIKNPLSLMVPSDSEEGRVIAVGHNYKLTEADMENVTLQVRNSATPYYAKLDAEKNQLVMTATKQTYEKKYYVTYDANGGGVDSTHPGTSDNMPYEAGDTATILANNFVRDGWDFTGWNTDEKGGGTPYQAGDTVVMPASNLVLYAQWEEQQTQTSTDQVLVDGKSLSQDTPYLASNGTAASATMPEGGYAYFDAVNGILELHDFQMSGNIEAKSAYTKEALTIQLYGTNTLTNSIISATNKCDLSISGSGSLDVTNSGGNTTVYVPNGNITIDGGAQVTLRHNGDMGETIHAVKGKITVTDEGTLLNAVTIGGSAVRADDEEKGGVYVTDDAKAYLSGTKRALYCGENTSESITSETKLITSSTVKGSTTGTTESEFNELTDLDMAKDYKHLSINGAPVPSVNVKWNANGGKFADSSTEKTVEVEYNTAISAPAENPTRADEGNYSYTFAGWSASAEEDSTVLGSFGEALHEVTYYAQWTKTQETFTITCDANGGSVSGGGTFEKNTQVTVTATPNSGYHFVRWTENGAEVSTSASYSFILTADRTLVAVFEQDAPTTHTKHTVTVNGSYATNSGAGQYAEGVTVTINAGSRSRYTFTGWTATGITLSNPNSATISFTMPGNNVTVMANWRQNSSTGGSSGGGGSSSPSYTVSTDKDTENGSYTVRPSRAERSDTVTITTKPDEGYQVGKVTVTDKNGDTVKVANKGGGVYTFTMPASAVSVDVTFVAEKQWTNPFADVAKDAWYYDAVKYVNENGLMAGTSANTFAPDLTTTRGMIVTILYRLAGSPDIKD